MLGHLCSCPRKLQVICQTTPTRADLDLPHPPNRRSLSSKTTKKPPHVSLTEDEFRLLTCPRPELSRMSIPPESLQRACPLDNDRLRPQATNRPASPSSMGLLAVFPPEIMHSILERIDLQCLTGFRAVNWRARALVDSTPPYNAIVRHCPDALRALLSTRMAFHSTARELFEALCTEACVGCGQFGPFLDMFTGHRYCFTCVAYSESSLSLTTSAAQKEFCLTSKSMHRLPTLLSIPGRYSEGEKMCPRRIPLVRSLSATIARSQQHLSKVLRQRPGLPLVPFPQRPRLPLPSMTYRVPRQFDSHKQNPSRFMAMLRFPFLDRQTGNLEWGVACQACRRGPRFEKRGSCAWNTVYSAAGYLEHFQKCEMSQIGRSEILGRIDSASGDQCIPDGRILAGLSDLTL